MASKALKAVLYGIRVGNDFVNCEIDSEITITRDMLNKSGSHGGAYKHFRYGYISWSISMSAKSVISILKGSFNNLIDAQLEGRELEVFLSARQSNIQQVDIGGTVLIPSISLSFPNSGASTHSVTFQGTGVLNVDVEDLGLIINEMPIEAEKPVHINTTNWGF